MTSNMPDEYGAEELPQPKRRTGLMIAVVGGSGCGLPESP